MVFRKEITAYNISRLGGYIGQGPGPRDDRVDHARWTVPKVNSLLRRVN